MKKATAILSFLFVLFGQVFANTHPLKKVIDTIPPMLHGNFVDDYGIRYTIDDSIWIQYPNTKYHIINWDTSAQYLLVQNDINNPGEGGLYTRVDYMTFSNMAPFYWGFCLTVYNAKTLEEAKAKAIADRQHPKQGCNGYPFSRMKYTD